MQYNMSYFHCRVFEANQWVWIVDTPLKMLELSGPHIISSGRIPMHERKTVIKCHTVDKTETHGWWTNSMYERQFSVQVLNSQAI